MLLDRQDSLCHRVLALALLSARKFDRAELHSERSLALNPNDANAAANRAYLLSMTGRAEEGGAFIRRAIQLNPYHPGYYWNTLARVMHDAGRHAEAIAAFATIADWRFHLHARLAACHAALGDAEQAAGQVERTLATKPDFSSAGWVATLPYRHEADRQRLLAELLAAGLPP